MNTTVICHTVLACVLVATYAALTATGHDGTALLGALGGQGLSVLIQGLTPPAGGTVK